MRHVRRRMFAIACFSAATLTAMTSQAETVRIGGAGVALAAMRHMGASLTQSAPNLRVEVLPSLSTPGGVKALAAGEIDITITTRSLTAEESAIVGPEVGCFTTALVFASSHKATSGLTLAGLPQIYADPSPTWPDGTPLKIILRLRDSPSATTIAALVPGFKDAVTKAHGRQGIPVAATDQDNAKLAQITAGSLTFMTLLQLRAERLDLIPLSLDGIMPSVATIIDQTYPLTNRVCLVASKTPAQAASQFVKHLNSPTGIALLRSFGAVPSS